MLGGSTFCRLKEQDGEERVRKNRTRRLADQRGSRDKYERHHSRKKAERIM